MINKTGRVLLVAATFLGAAGITMYAADAAAGKALYDKKCKTCHGPTGDGNPGMAKALNVQFKEFSGADIQKMSDGDLKKVITMGSGKMKAVAGLSDDDVSNAIAFVRSLKK